MVMGDLVTEVDVAVLGGGPGGYSAAFRCAELGLETVMIDAGHRLGGACLYEGCIPSKALLHVAAVLGEAERAKEFGVDFGEARISLDPMRKWKAERVVGKLARGLASVAKAKGVAVIGGRGAFEDSRSIRVGGDEPQVVRFKHAILATGSVPVMPPELAIGSDRIMDSTAALEVPDIPERMLVVGGGYIGLELGQVYAALGSRVTLVELTEGLLPGVDRDLVQPLARRCEKLFAAIHLGRKVSALKPSAGAIEAAIEGEAPQTFDRVLVAVGRRAVTESLGLEATRAALTERGFVAIDERCRTGDPHLYAIGDVTGEPMLAHRAMRQGKVAAECIAGRPCLRQRRRPRSRLHRSRGRLVRGDGGAGRPRGQGGEVFVGRLRPRRHHRTERRADQADRGRRLQPRDRCGHRRPRGGGADRRGRAGHRDRGDGRGSGRHHPRAPDAVRKPDGGRREPPPSIVPLTPPNEAEACRE